MGVAPRGSAGKQVQIIASWSHKVVGRTRVHRDLSFNVTVKQPPLHLSNKASYAARLGRQRSASLKFARRLYNVNVGTKGRRIVFRGSVTSPLAKPARLVVVRAVGTCSAIGRGRIVAKVKASRRGTFTARFTLPKQLAGIPIVYLRAQSVVARSGRKVPAYGLVRALRVGH
jgi:hypothetical protein